MNINGVKKAIVYLFKHNITGLLIGPHGVGKSTGVREYAEENGMKFIDLRLGQMEVGDLLGLPEIITDKNGDKVTVFARPKWFPTEGKCVLFLDEINRAKRDVIQAVFQLVLDRRLHDYQLPEDCKVIAAMNPGTDDYQTLDLSDKAFLDRFCHIKISSGYNDFVEYGNVKGINKSVLNFISAHPGMLRGDTKEFNLNNVTPSDRSWATASRLVDDNTIPEDIQNELVAGLVGMEGATAFMAWKKKAEKPIEGALVLSNYKKVRKEILAQGDAANYRADLLNETKVQILDIIKAKKENEELSDKEYGNLVAFLGDLPNDLFKSMSKDLFNNPKLFLKLAADKKLEEKNDKYLAERETKKKVVADAPKTV